MDKDDIHFLQQLLNRTDKDYIISYLLNTNNSLLLHYSAANYNWNSGFEVPTVILENAACDFGTGLLMFHYADGYRMLEDPGEVLNSPLENWEKFLEEVYNKLINLEFTSQDISFNPELTNIQKYKLKKSNPNIPELLINKSPGDVVDIFKI